MRRKKEKMLLTGMLIAFTSACATPSQLREVQKQNAELSARLESVEKTIAFGDKQIGAAVSESKAAFDKVEGTSSQLNEVKRELEATQDAMEEIFVKIKTLQSQEPRIKEETLTPTIADFEDEFTRISRRLSKAELFAYSIQRPLKLSGKGKLKVGSEKELTIMLYELLQKKKFEKIIDVATSVMGKAKSADLVEVAIAFRAEAFFGSSSFERAAIDYLSLIDTFPRSPQIPRALLLVGDCFVNLKKIRTAKSYYSDCVKNFPGREECIAAKKRLDAMG